MKKRVLSLLLALVMVLGLLPTAAFALEAVAEDTGEITTISGKAELIAFRDSVNASSKPNTYEGKTVTLTADIDLGGEAWESIGSSLSRPFKGTFEGGGHTITGLNVVGDVTPDYRGLFGAVESGGTVKNLGVSGTVNGRMDVGGVVGINRGTVTGCYNACTVTGTGNCVGGVAGVNGGTVTNCYNTGAVSGDTYVGGVIGQSGQTSTVENCYNTGEVHGKNTTYTRAVIGYTTSANKQNCYYINTCNVSDSAIGVQSRTAAQFASGEVAWRLQGSQTEQVWGQTLSGQSTDAFPVLTGDSARRVYKVSFRADSREFAAAYANPNGTVALPATDPVPAQDGYTFTGWTTAETGGTAFTANTPVTADITVYAQFADQSQGHSHPACGAACAHEGDETHEAVAYTALTQAVVDGYEVQQHSSSILGESYEYIIIPAGRYYLEENITTDKMVKLGGAVDLCFNGHTFTSTFGNTSSRRGALMLLDNAVFNACDCQDGGGFTSDGEYGLVTHYSEGVNCTVNLYGGTFTGRYLVLLGSTTDVTLTLDGATLNATDTALSTNGKVTIKSGSITSSGSYAVNVSAGDLTVTGGTIRNTGGYYHALRVVSPKPVKLSGSPVIQGGSQGDICLLYSTCKLEVGGLAGTYRVAAGSAVREDTPWVITTPATEDQSGCFTSATSGVGIRDVAGEDGKHTVQLYKTHTHAVSVDCETTGGAQVTFQALTSENGALYVDGAAAEVSQLNSGAYLLPAGNYYLAGDVRLDKQIRLTSQAQGADPANSTVNFCLNGYKLEYAGDHNYSPVIYVGTNAYALNICDCNPTGTDRTGNVIDDPVSGYTKVIWGGVITGGHYGGVTGGDAPVTLYGGTIAGNGWATGSIPVYGGGVDADNFVMCGGAVRYNKALYGGGVNAGGSFTMTGGTISDNWATTKNGGVHTVISSGTPTAVTLSGSAKITGNMMGDGKTTASNLNLVRDCVVTVGPSGLGENFQVGISTSTVPTASAPVTVAQGSGDTALTTDDLAKFSSDNSSYELKLSDGKIVLAVKPAAHVHAWATAWSKDDAHHWHACTAQGCGITDYASCGEAGAAYAAHVYDNDQDATCNTCGYTRTVTPPDPGPGPEPEPGESKGEVEVKPGTPAVAVDEETLKDLAGEAQDGQTVTVKLTVEKQDAPAHKAELESIIQGKKDDVLYLDLSLLKTTVQGDSAPATETVTDTGETVLEIAVPYDFTGKKDVTAYRKHGESAAEALTALLERPTENAADGSFFADRAGGVVYLYASKFSTYAIGYTAESGGSGDSSVPNTYKPNLHQPEHGTLTVFPAAASKGKTVTITPRPEEGYEVDAITVTDKNGKSLEVTKNANGTYTFTQPSGRANITAAMKVATAGDDTARVRFVDVRETAWYYDDVYYCAERGLMQGREDNAFDPEITTSRAMIAAILWRLAGEPGAKAPASFPDCVADSWYAPAVAWGTENGVVKGYDSGNFGPDDPITREQLALMLYRYAKFAGMDVSVGEDTNILSYKDVSETGEWAIEGLQWAAGAGIVNGKPGGLLDPKGEVTRAETAAMLRRFCEQEK